MSLLPAGGSLNLSNGNATLLVGNIVQGVSEGWDTLVYSYTNFCGTTGTTFILGIFSAWECDSINLVPTVTNGKNEGIRIHPNPGTGLYTVTLDEPANQIMVSVKDMLGRTITTAAYQNRNQFELDITNVASGAYLITVIADGVNYNSKLIRW